MIVPEVLTPVSDLHQPLAEGEGARLLIRADRGFTIEGDAKLLFEALANLVDNAIKFAGPGSTVRIFLNRAAAGPQIAVQDDGPGIPASERQAVLQRFYRSERGPRRRSGRSRGYQLLAQQRLLSARWHHKQSTVMTFLRQPYAPRTRLLGCHRRRATKAKTLVSAFLLLTVPPRDGRCRANAAAHLI